MSPTRLRFSVVVIIAALGVLAACSSSPKPSTIGAGPNAATQSGVAESNPAGDIPDNQAFVGYRDTRGMYSVTVPEGWAQSSGTASIVFSDKYNSIQLQSRQAPTPPTKSSVTDTDLPAIAASAKGYVAGAVSTVTRAAGTAILATYHANSPTNAVTGKYAVEAVERYVFYRSGHEIILTLAAPLGSDNVDPWRKVTDSFQWL